jgi:hypothetical protein
MWSLLGPPMELMPPTAGRITAGQVSIGELTMVVARRIGTMAPGMPMVGEAAPQAGTMAREAPPDGAEAPLHGTMDQGMPADTAAARLTGAAALAARQAGAAGLPPGAAAPDPFTELAVAQARGVADEIVDHVTWRNQLSSGDR